VHFHYQNIRILAVRPCLVSSRRPAVVGATQWSLCLSYCLLLFLLQQPQHLADREAALPGCVEFDRIAYRVGLRRSRPKNASHTAGALHGLAMICCTCDELPSLSRHTELQERGVRQQLNRIISRVPDATGSVSYIPFLSSRNSPCFPVFRFHSHHLCTCWRSLQQQRSAVHAGVRNALQKFAFCSIEFRVQCIVRSAKFLSVCQHHSRLICMIQ